ncbi:SGNH/GDSL hydrolase family protein [Granulicella arctica]
MRRTVIRLPEPAGERNGSVGEPSGQPLRLLFVGDSSAAGVGVEEQRFALAPQVASKLAALRGSAVRWQLIAKTGATTASAMELLDRTPAQQSDVLVFSLGTNDVTRQRSPENFLRDYRRLVHRLQKETGAKSVVISGLPPLHILPAAPQPLRWYLGQYARRLDRDLRRWVASSPTFGFVCLQWAAAPEHMAIDRYHPGAGQYLSWAQRIAECVHTQTCEQV